MKFKFNKGDRVMLVIDYTQYIRAGSVGIIVDRKEVWIKNKFPITYYKVDVGENHIPLVYEHQLVLI